MAHLTTFEEYLRLAEVNLPGGQVLNPKKFEKDLTRALNGITGYSQYQTRSAEKVAHAVAASVRNLGVQGTAVQMSGSGLMSNLTPIYQQYGVKNGEPKTDILIGTHRCSMKYAKDALVASALVGETRAVFAATFASHPDYQRLVSEQLLPMIKDTLSLRSFRKLRKQYGLANPAKTKTVTRTGFQNMLSKVLGLHSVQGTATANEREQFHTFLKASGVQVPLARDLYKFLDSPDTKQSVFLEFVSGRHRFTQPAHVASHLLLWDETGRVDIAPVEQYVASHLSRFSYSIREAHKAGALRIGLGEEQALHALVDTWIAESTAEMLTEASVGDMWDTATDMWQLFVNAAKIVVLFMLRMFREGIVAVMDFFDYEIPTLQWKP